MRLTWRDILTTLTAAAVVVALVAALLGYNWSLFETWRGAVATVGVLGALMLIFDETDFEKLNAWGFVEWTLALAGIGLVIAGLIVTSKVLFVILAADVLALWLASIARHAFSRESVEPRHTFPVT